MTDCIIQNLDFFIFFLNGYCCCSFFGQNCKKLLEYDFLVFGKRENVVDVDVDETFERRMHEDGEKWQSINQIIQRTYFA